MSESQIVWESSWPELEFLGWVNGLLSAKVVRADGRECRLSRLPPTAVDPPMVEVFDPTYGESLDFPGALLGPSSWARWLGFTGDAESQFAEAIEDLFELVFRRIEDRLGPIRAEIEGEVVHDLNVELALLGGRFRDN